ncbi:MAG TPA: substrate-binding domain-containing protein [Candidatus Butyricicoccus avistercoris]|uniref:Substrate-binding domain-containing protein n=1 Tax=Candidatus Butyricicoccus avistercoris TaxID=2838518 RepID=A0A9D1PKF9_9FIRM|nr:substrate-binding domain-containing protein [Candidatus Butyricicoccus avistercoris]
MNMKKRIFAILTLAAITAMMAGCGSSNDSGNGSGSAAYGGSDLGMITVVSREDGSGTRGAFIELMGIEQKDADGNKTDMTTVDAMITNKTDVMLSTIAGDPAAIGYVSLGSLNDNVKALQIDGAEATAENVKSGTYKVARPFNIATKGEPTGVAKDFINYILSADGQKIVSEDYISISDDAADFETDGSSGKIVVGGSSSVFPLMEKLAEGYEAINGAAEIEVQSSDSTAGMSGAADGTFDIGMASRALKDDEAAQLTGTVIANDGIAVIVNNENAISGLTSEQVQKIYTGEITDWSEVAE